jgi:hypothetical protein
MDVGILIIGSLYWEDGAREEWRTSRLLVGEEPSDLAVEVPIRYGRRSSSRNDTYTMVYSSSAGLGQARAVRCRNVAESMESLIEEARHLWRAEAKHSDVGPISARWGCVSVLVNPGSRIPSPILEGWAQFVRRQTPYGDFHHAASEEPILNRDGLLQLTWPNLAAGESGPAPFDVLLATATEPTLEGQPADYPSPLQIAQAWGMDTADHIKYFRKNRANRITSYQDQSILRELTASFPAKAEGIT